MLKQSVFSATAKKFQFYTILRCKAKLKPVRWSHTFKKRLGNHLDTFEYAKIYTQSWIELKMKFFIKLIIKKKKTKVIIGYNDRFELDKTLKSKIQRRIKRKIKCIKFVRGYQNKVINFSFANMNI